MQDKYRKTEYYRKLESRKAYEVLRDLGGRKELRELSGTVPPILITQEMLRIQYEPIDPPEMFSCPERMHGRHPFPREGNMDYYMKLHNGDHVCSFCFSLETAAFYRLLQKALKGSKDVRLFRTLLSHKVAIEQSGITGSREGATRFLLSHLSLLPKHLLEKRPDVEQQIQKAMSL